MNNLRQIKDILADLMARHGDISANQLSRQTGVPQPTISRILKGESIDPATSSLEPLAAFFGTSLAAIRGLVVNERTGGHEVPIISRAANRRDVPVISWIQAGDWNHASDPYYVGDADEWLPCPVPHSANTYALQVRGVSMEPEFHDGDYIYVDPASEAKHRSFVIVRLMDRDEAIFKQLIIEEGRRFLKPLNPAWPDAIIEINEKAMICGAVVFKGKRY